MLTFLSYTQHGHPSVLFKLKQGGGFVKRRATGDWQQFVFKIVDNRLQCLTLKEVSTLAKPIYTVKMYLPLILFTHYIGARGNLKVVPLVMIYYKVQIT